MTQLFAPISSQLPPVAQRIKGQSMQIKRAPRMLAEQLLRQWEITFDSLWSPRDADITPAMLLADLGTAAGPLFAANATLATFLLTTVGPADPAFAARVNARLATIPAHTIDADGNVTLD